MAKHLLVGGLLRNEKSFKMKTSESVCVMHLIDDLVGIPYVPLNRFHVAT